MQILAINTATEACSVALWNNGLVRSHFIEYYGENTQHILPLIKKTLDYSSTVLTEIDVLAFGRGPGSFTGIRIGISIAQGLALGAELPIIGISTLATMAQGAWHTIGKNQVLAAIDARMGDIYWAEYIRDEKGFWHGEESEAILKPESVNKRIKQLSGEWVMVGTGWKSYPLISTGCEILLQKSDILFPEAKHMLPIACQLMHLGKAVSVDKAEPIYLRNEIACKKSSRF